MTAQQALAHYREHGTFYMDDKGYKELAELIEWMKCCGNCKNGTKESCQGMNVVGWGQCDKWESADNG